MTAAGALAAYVFLIGPAATAARAQSDVYVVNPTANAVDVITTVAGSRALDPVNSINGSVAPSQIAISGDGIWTFVAYAGSSTVSKIRTTNHAEITTLDVGGTPASLAVNQTGDLLFVLRPTANPAAANGPAEVVGFTTAGGTAQPLSASGVTVGESFGAMAFGGNSLFVAAGDLTVIDITTGGKTASLPLNGDPNLFNFAVSIAVNPSGKTAYLSVNTYNYAGFNGFSATGGVWIVDVSAADAPTVRSKIPLFSVPDAIALAGAHLFVGVPYIWADSLYGAGFLATDWIAAIDTTSNTVSWINLGGAGTVAGVVYSAAGLAATPDGSSVFVAIPNANSVAVIDATTGALAPDLTISLDGGPTNIAIVPDAAATPSALKLVAGDDAASAPVPAGGIAAAIANVLANDTLGGVPATVRTVEFVDGPSVGVTLDRATGQVWVADGTDPGAKSFSYVIREIANPSNTATGHVSLTVRDRYPIAATGDAATAFPGTTAIADVLANDALKPGVVGTTIGDVRIEVAALDSLGGVTLDAGSGAVSVDASAAVGAHAIAYHICELAAHNCSGDAQVIVSVVNRAIVAANDAAAVPRTGAAAFFNVLANDTLDGAPAAGRVAIAAPVSDGAGVTIDTNGLVSVAHGAASGAHTLSYAICEIGRNGNCASGAVAVTVNPYVITAVADSARLSPKNSATAIANVLANDLLGDMQATTSNVRIGPRYTVAPFTDKIVLNASTGAISIVKGAASGLYTVSYQVCELADPSNCAAGKATINLSNGGGGGGGGGR